MHILYDFKIDNGVVVSHHEASEVRFDLNNGSIYVWVDSWLDSVARTDERPPVISRTLPLIFNPKDVAPMIYAAEGDIAAAVYNALLAIHFPGGELIFR